MPAVRQIARDDNPVVTDLVPSDVLCERYPDRPVVSFRETRTAKVGKKTKYVDVVTVRGGRYMVLGKPVFIPNDLAVDMPWRHGDANSPVGTDVFVLLNADAEVRILEFKPQYITDCVAAIDTGVVASWNDNGSLAALSIYDPEAVQMGEYFRVLGGMHTLCAGAGSITGSSHPMWQRPAGSVIPMSVWAVNFRPACPDPRAMAYVRETDTWVDIYNASGDIANPETRFGGVRLRLMTQTEFEVGFGNVGKRLLSAEDFLFASRGSPAGVTVNQNPDYGIWFGVKKVSEGGGVYTYADNDADTTGGHSSTDSKRLLSDIGCEEMCGLQNQFLRVGPRSGSTQDEDTYYYRHASVWTPIGWDVLGSIVSGVGYHNYSLYKSYYNLAAERAGGGAADAPEACGPASVNASEPNFPMHPYDGMDSERGMAVRDEVLAGEYAMFTSAQYMGAYYTGSRGCSPCLHINVRHQVLSSDILPNFLWFRNVWSEPMVLNFDNGWSSNKAVMEFAKLSGTMSWSPYSGSTEAQRTFNPGETMCIRAPEGVTNKAFGWRFRPFVTGSAPWPYTDRWRPIKGGVEVGGNVMSVLKQGATEFPDETTNCAFRDMFGQCPSLKSAKNLSLPAKMAVSGCYYMMFGDFDSSFTHTEWLEDAPTVSAVGFRSSTQSRVYEPCAYMFTYCSRLVNPPPELAMQAAMYYMMFRWCTSLAKPPRILATHFVTEDACYRMFDGCSSLTSVPVLAPVGRVGVASMKQMFRNTGIQFSTTQGGAYQYEWSLPLLESGSDGSEAFDGMLNGTTAVRGVKYYFTVPPVAQGE